MRWFEKNAQFFLFLSQRIELFEECWAATVSTRRERKQGRRIQKTIKQICLLQQNRHIVSKAYSWEFQTEICAMNPSERQLVRYTINWAKETSRRIETQVSNQLRQTHSLTNMNNYVIQNITVPLASKNPHALIHNYEMYGLHYHRPANYNSSF